jgi:hypothetical protein
VRVHAERSREVGWARAWASRAARAALVATAVALAATLAACPSRDPVVAAPIAEITLPDAGTALFVPRVTDAQAPEEATGVIGRWTGQGVQNDGQTWDIVVDITTTRPGPCGSVDYPGIPCSGEWICVSGDSRSLRAREKITEGTDKCIDNGTMTMSVRPDGSLDWQWRGSGSTAKAVLTRGR